MSGEAIFTLKADAGETFDCKNGGSIELGFCFKFELMCVVDNGVVLLAKLSTFCLFCVSHVRGLLFCVIEI